MSLMEAILTSLAKGTFCQLYQGPQHGALAAITDVWASRISNSARQTGPFRLNQMPNAAFRLSQSSPEGIPSMPKRNPDEDGKSVSSNMKNLSLQ
jgi:hypothetical protein